MMTIDEQRKRRVIDLYYNQGKTTREIAKIERMSIRDISAILKEEEAKQQKHKDQQQQKDLSSKAYKPFSEKKSPLEVAIILNLREPEVTTTHREYWRLKRLHILNLLYKETNGKLGPFLKLYRLMKEKGMSIEQVVNVVEIAIHKLPYMETLYEQLKEQVESMQRIRQGLVNDIEERKNKISLLDKTAFTSEQERKRTEQRVQDLTDKKDRLEKLIANILNGEGYSKLNQIVKENMKAFLAEKRALISVSFDALILTLKADPQIAKLIHNIPGANDSEQHDEKNNNISQYIESNKYRILHLAEKHYENLVEALTNDVIYSAVDSSSSLTLPLSSSLSTSTSIFDQSDIYKIEESEIYPNSKGDIAD